VNATLRDWTLAGAGLQFLVTGSTGSFGNTFVELMLSRFRPWRPLRFFLGDVRDQARLQQAMYGVDVVFHTAAPKQITFCEYKPFEAIQTNVIGTENVISAAIDQGVKRVIMISTDKAVNPINLDGATKLCAEKLFVQGNTYGHPRGTVFSVVRYGNVIASRGSVIPLFRSQWDSRRSGAVGSSTCATGGATTFRAHRTSSSSRRRSMRFPARASRIFQWIP
jgi:UDP-N-acetylglucosamine 4,6-dehydratase/5-epimerase